jgi:hypothetical protein
MAHRHHATVNDILLTAAAEALRTVLAEDGENVSALVVSVPVSRRVSTTATALGNDVEAMPVRVPCTGPLLERLESTAATTRKGRAGNVTVAFTAFSYAGTLSVTVVADNDRWPDARPIAAVFDSALRQLQAAAEDSPEESPRSAAAAHCQVPRISSSGE